MKKEKNVTSGAIKRRPRLERIGNRVRLLVDGKPFVALGAEVQNSSASDLGHMAGVWPRLAAMHCNTVLVPVYWELFEPDEGRYDFSLVRGLLAGARANGLRLILLWFGTWKNGQSAYTPAWVKQDLRRFPRGQPEPGRNSRAVSAFCEACCAADARAFASLMHYLCVHDRAHTVIMVQVENEPGFLGAARDHGVPAEKAFAVPVPAGLVEKMADLGASLHPEVRGSWKNAGSRMAGTWTEVFGAMADEVFMAWHVAGYIERVACAGKTEYPLPMFVNAWLNYGSAGAASGGQQPGDYPSGGPVARMHDIWRIAAPSIDALASDIYSPGFKPICLDFVRNGNPLIIPEAHAHTAAANVFWAVAAHNALCFAPFGVDRPHPWSMFFHSDTPGMAESYKLLTGLLPILAPHLGTERIRGILQTVDKSETFALDGFGVTIEYETPLKDGIQPGYGLIAAVGQREYYIAGRGFTVRFDPPAGSPTQVDILSAEDGRFHGTKWVRARRLNGDDTNDKIIRLQFEELPVLRRVVLYTHT